MSKRMFRNIYEAMYINVLLKKYRGGSVPVKNVDSDLSYVKKQSMTHDVFGFK